jgi:hypothetical protein
MCRVCPFARSVLFSTWVFGNVLLLQEASDRYKVKKDNWGNVLAKFGLYSLGNLAVFLPLLVDGKGDATLRYLTSVFGVGVAATAAGIVSNENGI